MEILQPPGWARPRGYSNGVSASGRLVCVSGMVGWDGQGQFQQLDFVGQTRQALHNIVAVLAQAGAAPRHIVRMTWYVLDKQEYLAAHKEVGRIYRELIGAHYPAMTAVQVSGLMEPAARLEIEVTAVVDEM